MARLYNFLLLFFLFVVGCAHDRMGTSHVILEQGKSRFNLSDNSGNFDVVRESLLKERTKEYIVRSTVYPSSSMEKKPVERSVTISSVGRVKKVAMMRPKISQYYVWFEDSTEKYFTQMKINLEKRKLDVLLKSPDPQWNKEFSLEFPSATGAYCFYSQVLECATFTGFIEKAMRMETGKMSFSLIWDSYPYIQQQYSNLSDNVFSDATLEYDGTVEKGEIRFVLRVEGQSIFYILNRSGKFLKKFWISQNLTMVRK